MAGDSTTIARPYAEAAFEVARASSALNTWSDALNRLAAIVADPQVASQIGNPNLSDKALLDLIFGVAGEGLSAEVQNLVRLLAENERLAVLPDLARLFDARKTAAQGVRHIQIRSAFALSDAEQDSLKGTLKGHFGADVELTVEQDPSLIGGLEVRADDVVIDGSVRGRLQQLANELQF
ncbi:F0F1 ATP synthase subunit delta [Halochromatium glycolicum]|uniref:ATP synthase subunit delta n=1 Tax=Halochromatium glycolicum TaxID=85075 RepID=A0AAJ0U246_9GAMM|nr:F0F1 ATP synthase subunit delta [Halochromatium glycolicum]MBK1703465.1 F0F1 ATP synthase subunit delta [Halochromatium glycolicum]